MKAVHSIPPLILLTCALTASAQTPPHFDVESVKLIPGGRIQVIPKRSGGRLTWPTNLQFLVLYAYNLPDWRMSGLPESSDAYLIDATTSPQATYADLRSMFQTLLANRFHLTSHFIRKEVDGYDLTVAKGGPKMIEARDGDPAVPAPAMLREIHPDGKPLSAEALKQMDGLIIVDIPEPGVLSMAGRRVGMPRLAESLSGQVRAPVADHTGLTGQYYFDCEFVRPDGPENANAPSLRAALQSLGLTFEKTKTAVDVLVVDSIEKIPTGN